MSKIEDILCIYLMAEYHDECLIVQNRYQFADFFPDVSTGIND